jgi:hypothetical protein
MTTNEKRRTVRVAKRLEVKFSAAAENTAITNDLSGNGMFITTCKGIDPGNVIDIRLNLPNTEVLSMRARVVRNIKAGTRSNVEKQNGMGVELITPPANYLSYIQSLLE